MFYKSSPAKRIHDFYVYHEVIVCCTLLYSVGAIGILWYGFWLVLAYSSPATHPRISHSEKIYIEKSIAEAKRVSETKEHVSLLVNNASRYFFEN